MAEEEYYRSKISICMIYWYNLPFKSLAQKFSAKKTLLIFLIFLLLSKGK